MISSYVITFLVMGFVCMTSAQVCHNMSLPACSAECDQGIHGTCVEPSSGDPCLHYVQLSCNSQACNSEYSATCDKSCDSGVRDAPDGSGADPIPCNRHSCTGEGAVSASGCVADVYILLDASADIGELAYVYSKQLVADLVRSIPLGADTMRVSIASYTSIAEKLVQHADSDAEQVATDAFSGKYRGGVSVSNVALRAYKELARSARPNTPQVLIMLGTKALSHDIARDCDATEFRDEVGAAKVILVYGPEGRNPDLDSLSSSAQLALSSKSNWKDVEYRLKSLACQSYPPESDYTPSTDVFSLPMQADPSDSYCDPMTEWSDCSESCGKNGLQTRQQTCYSLSSAGTTETITDIFYQVCFIPCPTPSDEPDCNRCDYSTGQFWLPDSQNCHKYYICVKNDRDDGSFYWTYHHVTCGLLYWDQSRATCTREIPEGCVNLPGQTVPPEITTPGSAECIYETDSVDEQKYHRKDTGTEFSCDDGEKFDDGPLCNCYDPNAELCDDSKLLYFPFEEHLHDVTCSGAQSEVVGDGEVTLVVDPDRGSVASFDGEAGLKVPFLRYWFKDQDITGWTVALWMKASDSNQGQIGLVDNGDCIDEATFLIHGDVDPSGVAPGVIHGGIDTDSSPLVETGDSAINMEEWTHIAMVYDGNKVKLYVNGVLKEEADQSGPISSNQNPLFMGFVGCCGDDLGYFKGLMDDVTVFQRALTETEINDLM